MSCLNTTDTSHSSKKQPKILVSKCDRFADWFAASSSREYCASWDDWSAVARMSRRGAASEAPSISVGSRLLAF